MEGERRGNFLDREHRTRAFDAFNQATELPMLALAVVFVGLVAAPLIFELSDTMETVLWTVDRIIWAAFALELTIKTYLAPNRGRYLISHWYDVLIVLLPLLRPLRMLKLTRLLRLIPALRLIGVIMRLMVVARGVLTRHGLHYGMLVALGLFLCAAVGVTYFEQDAGGSIDNFGTALWWTAVTVTTVGYGDAYPVTPEGRGIGVFVMLIGIALFSLLTAQVSAFFVEAGARRSGAATMDDVMAKLQQLEQQLAELRAGSPMPSPNGQADLPDSRPAGPVVG